MAATSLASQVAGIVRPDGEPSVEENGHGLIELKESQLRESPASIAGVCALAGIRAAEKSKRNHLCKYVSKAGPHSAVLAGIVAKSSTRPFERSSTAEGVRNQI